MTAKQKPVENTPDTHGDITVVPTGVANRLSDVESLTRAVLFVGLISLVAIVVSVGALVIDQTHFNNQTYRDQSTLNDARYQQLQLQVQELNKNLQAEKPKPTE